MKKKSTSHNITSPFVAKHSSDVIGVLSGFDRLRLRGTLRALYQPTVLLRYLFVCQVLLKGFKDYAATSAPASLHLLPTPPNNAAAPPASAALSRCWVPTACSAKSRTATATISHPKGALSSPHS
jgi:hypothetical protein